MERGVKERMTIQDVDTITPQGLINIRPVVADKGVLEQSTFSVYGQTNPLAELTHKKIGTLGPGSQSQGDRLRGERCTILTMATCAHRNRRGG